MQVCFDQYRCLRSNVCLSLDFLCDGYRQCPLGDDERFCDFRSEKMNVYVGCCLTGKILKKTLLKFSKSKTLHPEDAKG